ncbi:MULTISPECIES: DUF2848 domain-containing protein [Brevibacterium]|uniref:DUF2848 domain-containing protein n=1 Tax=Brevibacterium sediminis TaxID=1857024 RepID=A0A5C4X2A0_9MICO|nr:MULTISPECIES: DUF2848 domain-containing protein [Brevibacterium]MCS4592506.1 DUF2848 domain-containing protein [Brevibacterium sediminis]TNM54897.1 DUF2848 domain-containing protein [Brevibacterium sediminis]
MLTFELPDKTTVDVHVDRLLNAGYAGRNQEAVQHHIDELAALGVPGPSQVPALYPVSPYLAQQAETVTVQHGKSSGEAEWALVVSDRGVLITAASDQTDRDLEVYGVAWSKNAAPNILAKRAWVYEEIADHIDEIRIESFVTDAGGVESQLQDGSFADLLPPSYWLDELKAKEVAQPGTVLISGTIPMAEGVDQFASLWRVRLFDPRTEDSIEMSYTVEKMPEPVG